jgi:hypothetical protein
LLEQGHQDVQNSRRTQHISPPQLIRAKAGLKAATCLILPHLARRRPAAS